MRALFQVESDDGKKRATCPIAFDFEALKNDPNADRMKAVLGGVLFKHLLAAAERVSQMEKEGA